MERGIAELAITDHVDFRPGAPAYGFTTFELREHQVRDAARRWASQGVAIRFGTELTYEQAFEADIREHLDRHAYDFVIGSVHIGADSPFTPTRVAAWVAGRPLAEIVEPYYVEVEAAARSGLFDALGHIDFVKRYLAPHVTAGRSRHGARAARPDPAGARRVRDRARDQHQRSSPGAGRDVSLGGDGRRFRELGGERVSIGSDAHRAATLRVRPCGRLRLRGAAGFEGAVVPTRQRARRPSRGSPAP